MTHLRKIIAVVSVLWMFAAPAIAQDHLGDLCDTAQRFVRASLNAPEAAIFQPCSEAEIMRTSQHGQYQVEGYFDAQNSYGAMLREHYTAFVKYIAGRWEMVAIDLDNSICLPKVGCTSVY
jgi:hypothetical protein